MSGSLASAIGYIKASNTHARPDDILPRIGDEFGWAVGLSADGNTLVIGTWRESSAATGVNGSQDDNPGAVYLY